MQLVSKDIVGPLPTTKVASKYLLTFIDYLIVYYLIIIYIIVNTYPSPTSQVQLLLRNLSSIAFLGIPMLTN